MDVLDVNFSLVSGLYKPYRKAGDFPSYFSAQSNQPTPNVEEYHGRD